MCENCPYKSTCTRYGTNKCNNGCYPYILLNNILNSTNVPKKYRECSLENLPIEKDNPKAYDIVKRFIQGKNGIVKNVERGTGLFLVSQASNENPLGTGNGKTTSAITILNHYTIEVVRAYLRHEVTLEDNPSLFYSMAEFQSLYNSQFRGSLQEQERLTHKYNRVKELMMNVKLLVLDDICIRSVTENLENEIYTIINRRVTEGLTTIFTSNVGYEDLTKVLGERICSRIQGSSLQVVFYGKDHRIEDLF